MAVFRFRLETLLNVKIQLEKSAKNELGVAVTRLEHERRRLADIGRQLDVLGDEFVAAVSGNIDAERIRGIRAFIAATENEKERQKQKVKEASDTVDKIRDKVIVLMQERKVLEKLREKEVEAFRLEGLADEQRLNDELVTYRGRSRGEAGTV